MKKRRKRKKKSWMYVMVDELVDIVFGSAAVVFVFPLEKLKNLHIIKSGQFIQISKMSKIK